MSKQFEKRKQLGKYLRSSHFDLGNDKIVDPESEYIERYKEYPLEMQKDYGESLGLKKSHFGIGGPDNEKDHYTSIYKGGHTAPPRDAEQAKLNAETMRDLRAHHFVYGTQKIGLQSDYQENFQKKELPPLHKKEQLELKESIRKHHIQFGNDDGKAMYSSVYDQIYNHDIDPSMLSQGLSKKELMDNVVNLRKSNIPLGFDKEDHYASEMHGNFKPIPANYKKAGPPMDLKKTHFVTGTDEMPTESMYRHTYVKKPIEKAELNKELIKDLRTHHFVLGNKEPNYESVALGSYKEPPEGSFADKGKNPLLWRSHLFMGDTKLGYNTTYNDDLKAKGNAKLGQARDQRADRSSSVVFGYDKVKPETEAKSNYQGYPGFQKTQLEENLRKDLRQSHFKFDDPNNYESYSHAIHKDLNDQSKQINNLGLFKTLANDLRKSHFVLGNDPRDLRSVQQETHKDIHGRASALNPELAKDLRRHHFTLGEGKLRGDTIYRTEYVWKEATDD